MFRGLQMPLCQPRLPLRQIVALDPGKNPIATVSSQDHANEAALLVAPNVDDGETRVTNRDRRSGFQKFSIIHMLVLLVQLSMARWRPSGEGKA